MSKQVFIASDHAGFALKSILLTHLLEQGHSVIDLGPEESTRCDYPNSANSLCTKILENDNSFGILICGTGIGMSMAANRFHGIRAALATCEFHAQASRKHNDANVLCLGERVTGVGVAKNLADIFLSTDFEDGRHVARINLFN